MTTTPVIAIDGPAASGKSSTAAAVARALGAFHLDSGALYRGLTRVALDHDLGAAEAIIQRAETRGLGLVRVGDEIIPFLDGEPAEPLIRSPEVTAAVFRIAAMEPLRDWVNRRLRREASGTRWLVLDGRDIGTAVFPDAPVKIFLTATPLARAKRRLVQRDGAALAPELAAEAAALAARDAADASRAVAPLRQATDAIVIDTTELTFGQQVDAILAVARKALSNKQIPPTL
ncbi:MAG: (d)CMP kinase [Gemmatimonadetes bacterium]|nr:(d)CMP kinase [Gemmatimonadota bacterium]